MRWLHSQYNARPVSTTFKTIPMAKKAVMVRERQGNLRSCYPERDTAALATCASFTTTLEAQGIFVQFVFLEPGNFRGQAHRLTHGQFLDQNPQHAFGLLVHGLAFRARNTLDEHYKLAELLVGVALDPFEQLRQGAG